MATDIRFVNRFYNPFHVDADVPWPEPELETYSNGYNHVEHVVINVDDDRTPAASPYDETGLTKSSKRLKTKSKKEEKHKDKRVAERSRSRDRDSVHVVFQS